MKSFNSIAFLVIFFLLCSCSVPPNDESDFILSTNTPTEPSMSNGNLKGSLRWQEEIDLEKKADIGAKIQIHPLEYKVEKSFLKTEADEEGNYQIEHISPGKYLMIIRSEHVKDCPENLLKNIISYSQYLNPLFNISTVNFQNDLNEFIKLDSLARNELIKEAIYQDETGGTSEHIEKYLEFDAIKNEIAIQVINQIPEKFKDQIGFSSEGNAFEFRVIQIRENTSLSVEHNFGTDCKQLP